MASYSTILPLQNQFLFANVRFFFVEIYQLEVMKKIDFEEEGHYMRPSFKILGVIRIRMRTRSIYVPDINGAEQRKLKLAFYLYFLIFKRSSRKSDEWKLIAQEGARSNDRYVSQSMRVIVMRYICVRVCVHAWLRVVLRQYRITRNLYRERFLLFTCIFAALSYGYLAARHSCALMQIRHAAREAIIKAYRASRGAHSPQVAMLTDGELRRNGKIGFNCPDSTSTSRSTIKSLGIYAVAKLQLRHVNSSCFKERSSNRT